LRSRRRSASSAVGSPSCCSPASSSAWRSQSRSASQETPKSRASAVLLCPLVWTRRPASARDSAEYGG
jgi:hypothetical protein